MLGGDQGAAGATLGEGARPPGGDRWRQRHGDHGDRRERRHSHGAVFMVPLPEIERLIKDAGLRPARRNTRYEILAVG